MTEIFSSYTFTPMSGWAQRLLPAMGVWVFFITFAGQGVRNVVGWVPFGVLAALSEAVFIAFFLLSGRQLTWRRLPVTVSAFVLWCCLSVVWSFYPLETAVAAALMVATTLVGIMLAIAFPMRQLLGILTLSLQWMIALSFALEFYVAAILQRPLAPLYMRDWDHIPELYYWIQARLFEGGPIQGVFANRNPLAFGALLLGICLFMQWWMGIRRTSSTILWAIPTIATLLLTRSATVALCGASCVVVFLMVRYLRAVARERRAEVGQRFFAFSVFGSVVLLSIADSIFVFLGRSTDLTGRGVIWERVLELWQQKPVLGWGWIMYWAPWIPMFKTLVVRPDGTPTMQAHNAFIEALFQTGLVGAFLLALCVISVGFLLLRAAVRASALDVSPVWAVVLLTALLVQSLSESRLLSEGNWVLFVAFATWLTIHGPYTRIADSLLSRREVASTPTR